MIRYIYKSSDQTTDARLYKIFDKDGIAVGEVYNPRKAGAQVFHFRYFATGAKRRLAFYFKDTNQEIPELLRNDPAYAAALNGKYAGIVRRSMASCMMRMFEGEACIGGIIADLSEQGVYQIEYRGRRFTSYLASYGNDGSYLCVYDDRRCLIGEVRRFLPGYREYASYTVFAEEDGWKELLNFLTIHIDAMEYSENLHGDSGRIGHSGFCLRGHEFHDPRYIERIAAAESIDITRRTAGIAYGTERDAWENNRMPTGERRQMPFGENPKQKSRNGSGQDSITPTRVLVLLLLLVLAAFLWFLIK